MIHRDAEWTPDDRDWAIALLTEEAEECGGCGHPIGEAFDPDRVWHWKATPLMCGPCAARERAAREAYDKDNPSATDGLRYVVMPIEDKRPKN